MIPFNSDSADQNKCQWPRSRGCHETGSDVESYVLSPRKRCSASSRRALCARGADPASSVHQCIASDIHRLSDAFSVMVSTFVARAAAPAAAVVVGRRRALFPLSPPAWPRQNAWARCIVSSRSNHPPNASNLREGSGGSGDGAGSRGGVGDGNGSQGGPLNSDGIAPLDTPLGAKLAAGGSGGGAGGLLAAAAAWEGVGGGTVGAADSDASASRERLVINGTAGSGLASFFRRCVVGEEGHVWAVAVASVLRFQGFCHWVLQLSQCQQAAKLMCAGASLSDLPVLCLDDIDAYPIGYGDTSLTVSGVRVSSPVLLFPHFPTYWEIPSLAAALTPDALTLVKVVRPRPAVLLLGLPVQVPLPPGLRTWATAMGVGVEVMGVGEACHTFNLLNGDGVGVALGCVTRGALRRL